jgi:Tol biopolymer transport system component
MRVQNRIMRSVVAGPVVGAIVLALAAGLAVAKKPDGTGKPPEDPAAPEIAYVNIENTNKARFRHLYVMDADGGNKTLISRAKAPPRDYEDQAMTPEPIVGHWDPAWSPDKTQIVVVEEDPNHICQGTAGWWQMKVLDVEVVDGEPTKTGERTIIDCNHLMTAGNMRQPTWSHDGSTIAFLYGTQVRTIDPSGYNDSTLVHTSTEGGIVNDLAWSADGGRIAYEAGSGYDHRIQVITLTTGDVEEVLEAGYFAIVGIDWSHDGNWIAFGGHPFDKEPSIWRFDPLLGVESAVLVKHVGHLIMEINYSPDDSRYVFVVSQGGEYQKIWEYDTLTDDLGVLAEDRRRHLVEADY